MRTRRTEPRRESNPCGPYSMSWHKALMVDLIECMGQAKFTRYLPFLSIMYEPHFSCMRDRRSCREIRNM